MKVFSFIIFLPFLPTLWCCTSKQFDSSNGIDDTCNFYDSVRIMFDPHTEVLDISHLFFSAEISGVVIDSMLIDNGFYYSAISPNIKQIVKTSFSSLYSFYTFCLQTLTEDIGTVIRRVNSDDHAWRKPLFGRK